MLQNLRFRAQSEEGFTLIELLVVILIIGILAAIALPTFLGQKDKGKDASAKSAVRNAVSQVESCLTDDTPANCEISTDVTTALNSAAPGGSVTVTGADAWELTAKSKTNNTFTIKKAGSTITRPCDGTGSAKGGCQGSSW